MVASLPIGGGSGAIRSALTSSADAVAALETGLSAAEARVATILAAGQAKHMKGRCGPEPLRYPRPCDDAQMKRYLIQPDLYESARQKVSNALAINPAPADRERWYSASARWVNVMAAADNLAWTYLDGRMKNSVFATPDADTLAEDTRKRVFDAAQAVEPWAHKGDRKVWIDLAPQSGAPLRVIKNWPEGTTRGEPDRVMWTVADDYFEWSPWYDFDDREPYKSCGGAFGSPCPGYPSGKRYHRTIRTNGAVRVAWWKKKLEVYSKHPLADLLAYAWGGYSQYLDLNAGKLGLTPEQMRVLAEAKTRADYQAMNAKFEMVKYIPIFGQIVWGIMAGLAEVLPLAQGCQFSFYEFPERVIDDPECGAWGEGRTAASTIPKMYSTLIAQGFDPQARLDELNELNAPPQDEPTTPPWLVPAAAAAGGIIVGGIIGKLVS